MSGSAEGAAGCGPGRGIGGGAGGGSPSLEVLYLELRQVAKQHGLKIEYRLSDAGVCAEAPGARVPASP
jgi:hypothetical protein